MKVLFGLVVALIGTLIFGPVFLLIAFVLLCLYAAIAAQAAEIKRQEAYRAKRLEEVFAKAKVLAIAEAVGAMELLAKLERQELLRLYDGNATTDELIAEMERLVTKR